MQQRKSIYEILKEHNFQNKSIDKVEHNYIPDNEQENLLFTKWEKAEDYVRLLEWIRDANTPKTPDEEWNLNFCTAIRLLPEAKEYAEDCWWNYYSRRNGE